MVCTSCKPLDRCRPRLADAKGSKVTCKTKIVLAAGCLLVAGIVWWITGSIAVGGGFGALVALLFGRRGSKKFDAGSRVELVDLIEDGLEATEAQIESERETQKREATGRVAEAAAELEEKANAACTDPGAAPWRRRT